MKLSKKIFGIPIIVVDGGLSVNQQECLRGPADGSMINSSNTYIFSKKDPLRYQKNFFIPYLIILPIKVLKSTDRYGKIE